VGVEQNTNVVAAERDLAAVALMNASGTGQPLFVINLCASMAPIPNVPKSLPGLDSLRLYQVARREDGRTRYRLRLGFFSTEEDAESVLVSVRDAYPTAFTTCLCDEDRRFARGFVPEPPRAPKISVVENKPAATPPSSNASSAKAPQSIAPARAEKNAGVTPAAIAATAASKPAVAATTKPEIAVQASAQPKSAPTPAEPVEIELSWEAPELAPSASAPNALQPATVKEVIKAAPANLPTPKTVATSAPAKTAPTAGKKIEAPSKLLADIELSLESDPAPAPQDTAKAKPADEPFRVSRGVDIPATSLSLESTMSQPAPIAGPVPAKPASVATSPGKSAAAEISRLKAAQASAPASIRNAVAPGARQETHKLPDLDSTQTIRALTSDELEDESKEKWFAIELAVSEQPVNLDTMPRLDIFEAYRLYSVAVAGSGKITHSLRIGFFREEVSAEAVAGYLKTFFAAPTVVRISIAEHARFKDPPTPKQAAPKTAEVLDLSHARDRAAKPIPTVTMAVETPRFDPNATGSFKASATGAHKALASGAHKALTSTGVHRALNATGTHKAVKAASKSAMPPTKRSEPLARASATGRHKSLQPKKSLEEQLLEEARQVELSESGIRKLPKSQSLLAKMFGRRK
jgi:hypothetical protein